MLGFLFGTACLIGFLAVWRERHRYACAEGFGRWGHHSRSWGGGWHGGWGGEPGAGHEPGGSRRGAYGWGERAFLRGISERLSATPGQEKVIAAAFEELRESTARLRRDVGKTREDIARAVRTPGFDETLLGETFARHDEALEELRRAFVGAMAKVHEVLEEEQRERLARLIELGPLHGWGDPFRN